jgi:hypothetical protein
MRESSVKLGCIKTTASTIRFIDFVAELDWVQRDLVALWRATHRLTAGKTQGLS